MVSPYRKLLRSNIIWRLSGLSYRSAVMATLDGSYLNKNEYFDLGRVEMTPLMEYFHRNDEVLEFGCGPGKNLFAVSNRIKQGMGLDVNKLYIRLARKLSKFYKVSNLAFESYNGADLPNLHSFDVIFSKGVFERLPKGQVLDYVRSMNGMYLREGGIMILYFLSERALNNPDFIRRLGADAYVTWSHAEIKRALENVGLRIIEAMEWENANVYVAKKSLSHSLAVTERQKT